ncbi:MAG: hypothetical protein C0402_00655 [Thermodesulfovibrio sp.]|nr:hypothetical protein [Thermodesulfovibrio sp.]
MDNMLVFMGCNSAARCLRGNRGRRLEGYGGIRRLILICPALSGLAFLRPYLLSLRGLRNAGDCVPSRQQNGLLISGIDRLRNRGGIVLKIASINWTNHALCSIIF